MQFQSFFFFFSFRKRKRLLVFLYAFGARGSPIGGGSTRGSILKHGLHLWDMLHCMRHICGALDETCASFPQIGARMPWAHLIVKEKWVTCKHHLFMICMCSTTTSASVFMHAYARCMLVSSSMQFQTLVPFLSNFKLLHDPWVCSLLLNCICSFSWSQKRQNAAFLPGMKCDLCVFCFVVKLN